MPRVNLNRYNGVLAPNHRWRGLVTPEKRGKGVKSISNAEVRLPAERHAAMTWAQSLKGVFNVDIEVCCRCGWCCRIWRVCSRPRSTLALTHCGSGNPGTTPFWVCALCERFQKGLYAFCVESGMFSNKC